MFSAAFGFIDPVDAATFQVDGDAPGRQDVGDAFPGDGQCLADNGRCTLRAAIEESNSLAGSDRIELPPGRFVLALGELRVSDSLIINGAGAETTIIDADGTSRVLVIAPRPTSEPIVRVADVTITGGRGTAGASGAGVVNGRGGSLVLSNTIIRDNDARVFGGGVTNSGFLQIFDSTIRDNTLPVGGGGVTSSGGGIFNSSQGSVEVERSLITGNEATRGGGIRNAGGRLEVVNSTISGNTAFARGGGLMNFGVANISFSTITLNEANAGARGREERVGGGIFNVGTVNLGSTILAGNTDNRSRFSPDFSPDCFSTNRFGMVSFRNNVLGVVNENCDIGDTIFGDLPFDQAGSPEAPLDPGLEPLADNGGPTLTHALREDSPALDEARFVTSARFFDCPSTDQRGFERPGEDAEECDVGAFEAGAQPVGREVAVDIRPRVCPNAVRQGVPGHLPVMIAGTESLDVDDIDMATVRLAGIAPRPSRFRFGDLVTPFEPFLGKAEANDCTRRGPDGFRDLLLRFDLRRVVSALGPASHRDVVVVPFTGALMDGTPIRGEDVVVIWALGR